MARHLIIFCKNPRLGFVKTRIAATVGDTKALEIYIKLLYLTKQVADSLVGVDIHVFYDSLIDHSDLWPESLPYGKHLQCGNDLGARMAHAFESIFEEDVDANVLIIGSDCATLTDKDIYAAFETLIKTDLVLGPSEDGGYYLLGMRQRCNGLFDNMEWSTSSVLSKTIDRIEKSNRSYTLLRTQVDIDTYDQWLQHFNNKAVD